PHHLRRNCVEMGSALPANWPVFGQPEIRFVDQRRALKRVIEAFSSKVVLRNAAQLFVENRSGLVEGLGIAFGPILEERGNRLLQRRRHWASRRLQIIPAVYSPGAGLSMGEGILQGYREGVLLQLTLLRAAGATPGGEPGPDRLP